MTEAYLDERISDLEFAMISLKLCGNAETRRGGKLTSHDANFPSAWIAFALASMLWIIRYGYNL